MRAKPKSPQPPALDTFALLSMRWAEGLTAELRRRVVRETAVRRVQGGGFACRKGEPVKHWIGVIEGLVKIASASREGKTISFTGIPAGGWFGEGSLLKNEPRGYDAIALGRAHTRRQGRPWLRGFSSARRAVNVSASSMALPLEEAGP